MNTQYFNLITEFINLFKNVDYDNLLGYSCVRRGAIKDLAMSCSKGFLLKPYLTFFCAWLFFINTSIAQSFTFKGYDGDDITFELTVNVGRKTLTEKLYYGDRVVTNNTMPYYNYFVSSEFVSFSKEKGISAPKSEDEDVGNKSVVYITPLAIGASARGTSIIYLQFHSMLNLQMIGSGIRKNLKSLGDALTSKTTASTQSTIKQPRAVFHGTRFVKLPGSEIEFGAQCNVSVFNAKGKKVSFTAFFDGATRGVGLKDYNGKYCTGDGHVCAPAGEFICNPEWEGTQWSMMTQTIPLSELHLADGNHTINVRWFAFVEGKIVGNSDYQTIHFTKKGNNVYNYYVEGGEATPGYFE